MVVIYTSSLPILFLNSSTAALVNEKNIILEGSIPLLIKYLSLCSQENVFPLPAVADNIIEFPFFTLYSINFFCSSVYSFFQKDYSLVQYKK